MSQNSSDSQNPTASDAQAAPAKKKSPLEMKRELQARMQSNRAAKEKRPDPNAAGKSVGSSQVAGAKPMRSSASKQGG